METVVYSNEEVAKYLESRSIPVALDFDADAEVADRLGVTAVPAAILVPAASERPFGEIGAAETVAEFLPLARDLFGRYEAALAKVAELEEKAAAPGDPGALYELAEAIRAAAGPADRFLDHYRRVAELDPANRSGKRNWARFRAAGFEYEADRDPAKAAEALARVAADVEAAEPIDTELAGELAWGRAFVLIQGGRTDEGVRLLESLVERWPDHPRAKTVVEKGILDRFRDR